MENIKSVVEVVLNLLNTKLSFGSVSFSVFQYFIALFCLSISVFFLRKLFS